MSYAAEDLEFIALELLASTASNPQPPASQVDAQSFGGDYSWVSKSAS